MDKQTLSNYGWIVVCVLVLATLLAFASPFSSFLARGFEATSAGFAFTAGTAMDNTLENLGVVPSTDELQEKHKFDYYSSLVLAVNDINAGTIGENADVDKEHAVAGIYEEEGKVYAVLLKDSVEATKVEATTDMTINLGGNTLKAPNNAVISVRAGNVVLDGRLSGSKIISENITTNNHYTVQINKNASLEILGTEITKTATLTDSSKTAYLIYAAGTIKTNETDMTITSNGGSIGIRIGIATTDTAQFANSTLNVVGKGTTVGLYGYKGYANNITIDNCEITTTGNLSYGINLVAGEVTANNTTINSTGIEVGSIGYFEPQTGVSTFNYCSLNASSSPVSKTNNAGIYSSQDLNINNSTINITTHNNETIDTYVYGIWLYSGNNSIKNSKITTYALDTNKNGSDPIYSYTIYTNSNSNTLIEDSDITMYGKHFCSTIQNFGTMTINDSKINAYADYLVGYECWSKGIINSNILTLNNSEVFGVHSGVSTFGPLTINGGTYTGVGHGGLYLAGTNDTHNISDATIKQVSMPKGYKQTKHSNNTGFYIGGVGESDIKVYVNNCTIEGVEDAINLTDYAGERNNSLYISNSTFTSSKYIDIEHDTHKVYLGAGNNFTIDNTSHPSQVTVTNENYLQ